MKKSKKKRPVLELDQPLVYDDHKVITRRQALAQGFIGFSALAALPSAFGYELRRMVSCSGGSGGPKLVPFLALDMAGGAALPGNYLVLGRDGDLIRSYDKLGWNPREGGSLYENFGIPLSAKYSKILEGILNNTSEEARANFRMAGICHFARDDSSANQMNAASLALLSGFSGTYISNGLGVLKTDSGGRSRSAHMDSALRPTFVRGISDVLGATSFGGPGNSKPHQLKALANGGVSLSRFQKEIYRKLPGGEVLAELSKCAYEKSLQFVNGVAGLDPRQDATVREVYGIQQNTDQADRNAVAAAVSMNVIRGYSGPGVWTLGGCDYHNNTQTRGDGKDGEMGVQIGRAVELAHRLKKPLFFQLLTDGGCSSTVGTRIWRGDAGDKCMTVMGFYHPKEAPKLIQTQVGYYTNGQGAERGTLLGSNPQLVGYAVFANYLHINGKIRDFHKYLPGVFTEPGELDSVLCFEPVVV